MPRLHGKTNIQCHSDPAIKNKMIWFFERNVFSECGRTVAFCGLSVNEFSLKEKMYIFKTSGISSANMNGGSHRYLTEIRHNQVFRNGL